MNVLLVEPKPPRTWGANNQFVGLLRIANWLIDAGNNIRYVRYADMPEVEFYPDEIYVTSMFTYDYRSVWEAIQFYRLMYPKAFIRLGGIYATLCPDHAKQSGADEVFVGQHPEAMHYPPDPSLLPYKQKIAYTFTGYGCDRSCTFCATNILFGRGVRQLPAEQVVDDLEFLRGRGFGQILLGDDNILANKEDHIQRICEEILRRGIKVNLKVPGGMSAKDLDLTTAKLMRDAGFSEVSFGFESASPEQRKRMGRANHTDQDDLANAIDIIESVGFKRNRTRCFFLIGLPYQTVDDMLDSLLYLISLGVEPRSQRLTPIPGTVDWKRMGLEEWDLEDLGYSTFVAPDQDNFTGDDLRAINALSCGFVYTIQRCMDWISGYGKTPGDSDVPAAFREKFVELLIQAD